MRLRSRLVLTFSYILLTVIVAFTIPLAVNLSRRAETELSTDTLVTAQTLAAYIGAENIGDPAALRRIASGAPSEIERVVIMDRHGIVVYDSAGTAVGADFANGDRPEVVTALAGTPTASVRYSRDAGNRDLMLAAAPIIDERIVGAIRLTRDAADLRAAERRTFVGLIVIGASALLAGILIAFGLAGSLARPIQRLAGTARRLGRGDLSARAGDVEGAAEVQDLAGSFDEMADRLERTVIAQREFVANASHQLRTPLTGMKLRLESATDAPLDPDVRRQLEAAEKELDRLSDIVNSLLAMAREIEEGAPTHVDLADAAARAVARWADRAHRADASIDADARRLLAQANPTDVDQMLDNALDNAIAYAPGPIEIRTGSGDGRVWISVRDHGPGIPPAEREHVLERFYRGRTGGAAGSGLGLAIARDLAAKWGGDVVVGAPTTGDGTLVEIRLLPVGRDLAKVVDAGEAASGEALTGS
jgi:two-component system, OmpR family, sensor kinase